MTTEEVYALADLHEPPPPPSDELVALFRALRGEA